MAERVEFVQETLGDMDARWAEPLLESPGCQHLYTARTGGVSEGEFDSLNFRRTGDAPENIRENCRRPWLAAISRILSAPDRNTRI